MVRGQIRLAKGKLAGSGEAFEEGREIIDAVVAKNPSVTEYLHTSSMLLSYVGEVRLEQGQTAIARKALEKAIAVERDLLKRNGNDFGSAVNLIDCQSMLARLERESGRMDVARKVLGLALPEMTKLVLIAPNPANFGVQFKALVESSLLNGGTGKQAAARIGPLLEGLRQREDLVRKHPGDVNLLCQVVSCYLVVAQSFAESGATEDGLKMLETAASLLTPALQTFSDNLRLRALSSRIDTERGTALARAGKTTQALDAARRAVAIAEKLAVADTSYLYDLVCALALESRLDPAAPRPRSSALAALRKALEAGFDNVHKLETDPQLVPFHSLDEFRELTEHLKRANPANPNENGREPAGSR